MLSAQAWMPPRKSRKSCRPTQNSHRPLRWKPRRRRPQKAAADAKQASPTPGRQMQNQTSCRAVDFCGRASVVQSGGAVSRDAYQFRSEGYQRNVFPSAIHFGISQRLRSNSRSRSRKRQCSHLSLELIIGPLSAQSQMSCMPVKDPGGIWITNDHRNRPAPSIAPYNRQAIGLVPAGQGAGLHHVPYSAIVLLFIYRLIKGGSRPKP